MSTSYDIQSQRGPQHVADVGRDAIALHHIFGADLSRRGNLCLIESDVVMYAVGNTVVFQNITNGKKQYLLGLDGGGVGCVAVHPTRRLFAVGGKGFQPKIVVYSYPEKTIKHILIGGGERGFANLNFSASGTTLASLSTSPDFMLTVWNWEEERIALHSKAFGQDVFSVKFSIDDERRLTTCGTGHIRFWKMAATFTGLKLQGYIGKFGKVELSDIAAFAELPDGKVVSGTESGSLLLWEGNFIKCRFTQVGGNLCHRGEICYVDLDRKERCLITAGLDGFIRWWDFDAIDSAEVDSDNSMDFELQPIATYHLTGVGIKSMIDTGVVAESTGDFRGFIILDSNGALRFIKFPMVTIEGATAPQLSLVAHSLNINPNAPGLAPDGKFINNFHAGAVPGLDTSPLAHFAVTSGVDGTVRVWDYVGRKLLATRDFASAATALRWLPLSLDADGHSFLVGFADGVVRMLKLAISEEDETIVTRTMVMKPHNAPVTDLSFDTSRNVLATSGKDGIVFFFNCTEFNGPKKSWTPLCFVTIAPGGPKAQFFCEKLSWRPSGASLLCSCSDTCLREVTTESVLSPQGLEGSASYEVDFQIGEITALIANRSTEPATAAPGAASATATSTAGASESKEGKSGDGADGGSSPDAEVTFSAMKMGVSIFSPIDDTNTYCGAALQGKNGLVEMGALGRAKELSVGVYSAEGKDATKPPRVTSLNFSLSQDLLLVGLSDGAVVVRPTRYIETFARVSAHNGNVLAATTSFDDNFLLSVGQDGCLAVHLLRLRYFDTVAQSLFLDLDAGVYAGITIKPPPKSAVLEPGYLTSVDSSDSGSTILKENIQFKQEAGTEMVSSEVACAPAEVLKYLEPTATEVVDLALGSYSIQDAKLKSEEDARRVAAENLKNKVRASVKKLQADFEVVRKMNLAMPPQVRLTPDEMAVDGKYLDMLREEGLAQVEEVHKECAYEEEKARALRSKIVNRLMPGLIVEEISLYAFEKGSRKRVRAVVKSLRTQGIDPAVSKLLSSVQRLVKQEELEEAHLRANEFAQQRAHAAITDMQDRFKKKDGGDGTKEAMGGTVGGTGRHTSTSAAARRDMRKQRKQNLAAHEKEKPNENDDDDRDIRAISLAEKTMGDFKLKCGDDYEVPEEQRVNASKKCRQMALLEESMVTMRLQFNERFFALRELKRQIILSIRRDNARVREIDRELRQTHLSYGASLWEPTLDAMEFIDDRDEVTEAEIKEYMAIRETTPWAKAPPVKHSVITGSKTVITKDAPTGVYDTSRKVLPGTYKRGEAMRVSIDDTFLTDPHVMVTIAPPEDMPKEYEMRDNVLPMYLTGGQEKEKAKLESLEKVVPILMTARQCKQNKMVISSQSPALEVARDQRRKYLEHERKMLLQKMEENVREFDDALNELRFDRHTILADLKLTELKLLVMYQEYQLLQTFESRDIALQQKQIRCMGEKNDIQTNTADAKTKLDGKMDELSQWTEKSNQIFAELKVMLPDGHPFGELLTKIFKKKIKRKKMGDDGEEDEEEEEEEDDDEEEEEVEDTCPPGCDPLLHEKVLDLREKRLDTEEISSEIQKSVDELKKSLDRLRSREKQIIKDSKQAELEMQQFQQQKQGALNQISVVVPLRLSQLHMFETSGVLTVPSDQQSAVEAAEGNQELADSIANLRDSWKRKVVVDVEMKTHVLCSRKTLKRLDERIGELHIECEEARANFQELHKERVRLNREREKKREEIAAWEKRCSELQMLKFGRVIDIDELESEADRTKEEEAEAAVREIQENLNLKTKELAQEIEQLQAQLAATTLKNTELLNMVGELTEQKLTITRELNSTGEAAPQENKIDEFREKEERKRIASYVDLQRRELEALRAELFMLKRKDAASIMMPSIPMPQPPTTAQFSGNESFSKPESMLPPIPGARK